MSLKHVSITFSMLCPLACSCSTSISDLSLRPGFCIVQARPWPTSEPKPYATSCTWVLPVCSPSLECTAQQTKPFRSTLTLAQNTFHSYNSDAPIVPADPSCRSQGPSPALMARAAAHTNKPLAELPHHLNGPPRKDLLPSDSTYRRQLCACSNHSCCTVPPHASSRAALHSHVLRACHIIVTRFICHSRTSDGRLADIPQSRVLSMSLNLVYP